MKPNSLGIYVLLAALSASGCGEYVREGRGPTSAVVATLEGKSGHDPALTGGILYSDVITLVKKTLNGAEVRVPTVFADSGLATISVDLKNSNLTSPSTVNQ